MDQRMRSHLIDTGVLSDGGLTRAVKYRRCPNGCGLVLLACQDMGMEVWCDPYPVTPAGELAALLEDRRTWTLLLGHLCWRHPDRISFRDANGDPVHADHKCGHPQPEINWKFVQVNSRPAPTDAPPF